MGHAGQARDPTTRARTACQMSTYGSPTTRTWGPRHPRHDPGLLRPWDEMVDQHAELASLPGCERSDDRRQVVDAVQRLDHDARDAEVVAPYLLDQFGVMHALDVDPRGGRTLAGRPGQQLSRSRFGSTAGCPARTAAEPAAPARLRAERSSSAGRLGRVRRDPPDAPHRDHRRSPPAEIRAGLLDD